MLPLFYVTVRAAFNYRRCVTQFPFFYSFVFNMFMLAALINCSRVAIAYDCCFCYYFWGSGYLKTVALAFFLPLSCALN